jgi:hypothetical protein
MRIVPLDIDAIHEARGVLSRVEADFARRRVMATNSARLDFSKAVTQFESAYIDDQIGSLIDAEEPFNQSDALVDSDEHFDAFRKAVIAHFRDDGSFEDVGKAAVAAYREFYEAYARQAAIDNGILKE